MSSSVQYLSDLKIDFFKEEDWCSLITPREKILIIKDNLSDCTLTIGKFLKKISFRFEYVIIVMGEETSLKEQELLVEVAFGPQNVYIVGTYPVRLRKLVFAKLQHLRNYKNSSGESEIVIISHSLEERDQTRAFLETYPTINGVSKYWY